MTKVYSTDREIFNYRSAEEAAEIDLSPNAKIGDTVHVWGGHICDCDIIPNVEFLIDDMRNIAQEKVGGISDDWLHKIHPGHLHDLQRLVIHAINTWFDNHNLRPNFYAVANINLVRLKITRLEPTPEFSVEEGE